MTNAGLSFKCSFYPTKRSPRTAAEQTSGRLEVTLAGTQVWDFEWSLVEILEHLATYWRYIAWEEGCPIPIDDFHAFARLQKAADDYFEQTTDPDLETAFWAFVEVHDLSRAFHGMWTAPLWLLRAGKAFHVWSPNAGDHWLDEAEVLGELSRFGEQVARQLQGCEDERATMAIEAWKSRTKTSPKDLVSIVTGLSADNVVSLSGSEEAVKDFWEVQDFQPMELAAAARMMGTVPNDVLKQMLDEIRRIPSRKVPDLDRMSRAGLGAITSSPTPWKQGASLARWFRAEIGNETNPIDPEQILRDWDVEVVKIKASPIFDAVCCWGPRHGPAVMVNKKGRFARTRAGFASTLAHEIAHLLADRNDALPFAEVMGGRMIKAVEQRARAFAAELILPELVVRQALESSDEIKTIVDALKTQYGASAEIVAWQAKKSEAPLSTERRFYLQQLVSRPNRF